MLRRGRRLAHWPREASLGQISSELIHFDLLLLVLHVQQLHVLFEAPFLLSHIFDMLAFLLKLVRVRLAFFAEK
jgi:hypothetical protein